MPDPDAFPAVRRKKPPKRGVDPTQPKGRVGQLVSAGTSAVRQFRPKRSLSSDHPEARLAAMDAKWWMIAQFDSVVVSSPDGASTAWYHRDPEEFSDLLARTVDIHQRLYREWPRLSVEYKAALSDLTSVDRWSETFEASKGGG
jgi:galactofuranosylgalactofuranosylrhamnosyl-N-acetylglucosaminyl-diphospho-decaprenol beta-1,5/1,6-galactofuranosyltransferase